MPAGRNKSMTWFCENTIHSTTSIYNQSSFQKQNNDPMSLAQEYWPKCHSHSPSTTGAHRRGLILPKCCLLQSSTITCHRQCHAKKKRCWDVHVQLYIIDLIVTSSICIGSNHLEEAMAWLICSLTPAKNQFPCPFTQARCPTSKYHQIKMMLKFT